ncbi:sialidase family protein [Candidatus Laterigemmans baculatus]|uniref:sialidase family protein n=1 Tax=Candidatus Laterigemmans baculatus TaxID=2770505 RepID=UPI0013DA2CE7|nr:sialidase family protein [Candidatus Laterigemmans baculatus]
MLHFAHRLGATALFAALAASGFVIALGTIALGTLFTGGSIAAAQSPEPAAAGEIRLARFSADVTIPLGHRCMGILPAKASKIVDPLQVHGFVLLGEGQPIVLAAFDWCEIRNGAYDAWREALAEAAGTSRERVLVSSLHQHDAPVIDSGAQQLLDEVGLEGELYDRAFHQDCLERVSQAVRNSLATAKRVTHVGVGQSRVIKVASNRRLEHLDGRVDHGRYSSGGTNPFQADAPEGLIDPMLKTLSFWSDDEPLLAVNHYAVHPMSYYGRGGVSYDFVGIAREERRRESGVPQIYLSGCSGDVVAGKYNEGTSDSRRMLADRLREAMARAWEATEKHPVEQLRFRNATFDLPFHEGEEFTEQSLRKILEDDEQEISERILAAMGLSSRARIAAGQKIDLPCVDFGFAQIVLLPGEAFVGYQVMAQQMRPDSFVMAIGYGECWPGYVPTALAFAEGFNHGWRWAGPGSEEAIKSALREVLRPTSSEMEQTGEWQQIALPEEVEQRCLEILREGLASDQFWPAMHAAEGLTRGGHGESLLNGLAERLAAETDAQRRCGLARELVRAGEVRYTRVLLETLADTESSGRTHAAESLFKVDQVGDGKALRGAMEQSENLALRLMASAALARQGNAAALATIRAALDAEADDDLRIAAWVLGRVGESEDIARLKAALGRAQTPLTRAFIEHSLAALGDPEGLHALAENLSSEDAAIRTYAATFAGDARATSLAPRLVEQLDDPELDARIRAAQTLLELQQPPVDRDAEVSYLIFEANEMHPRNTEGSIIELADGTLLFAITRFEGDGSDFAKAKIVSRQSQDGGRTWTAPRVLQENVGEMNVMSATLRRLGSPNQWDSPIGMFYLVKNSKSSLDLYLRISEDEAKTFGEPIKVNQEPGYHVMNNDRVTRLSSGRLLGPVAFTEDVAKSNHFVSFCLLSDDNGKTWRRGRGSMDQPKRGAMEPEVVELRDGRVMMIARTQLGIIAAAHSSDGGDTWSEPFALPLQAPEAPATLRRVPATGDLLLIWNNTYDPDQGHGGRRTPLTAAISSDEGKSWQHLRNLQSRGDRTYAYTSLTFVGGRAVMSYWDQDAGSSQYSARFHSLPVGWFYESTEPAPE